MIHVVEQIIGATIGIAFYQGIKSWIESRRES